MAFSSPSSPRRRVSAALEPAGWFSWVLLVDPGLILDVEAHDVVGHIQPRYVRYGEAFVLHDCFDTAVVVAAALGPV